LAMEQSYLKETSVKNQLPVGQAALSTLPNPAPRSTRSGGGEMSTVIETSEQTSFPSDLSVLSVDELLMLSSRCFRQLDREHPVRDAIVLYYAIAQELETREAAA